MILVSKCRNEVVLKGLHEVCDLKMFHKFFINEIV